MNFNMYFPAATTVGFNGSQNLRIIYTIPRRYQAEELSFRFKTPMDSGLLFTTTSSKTPDLLNIRLIKGVVKVIYNVGEYNAWLWVVIDEIGFSEIHEY